MTDIYTNNEENIENVKIFICIHIYMCANIYVIFKINFELEIFNTF